VQRSDEWLRRLARRKEETASSANRFGSLRAP
jgi:hypothetical protein